MYKPDKPVILKSDKEEVKKAEAEGDYVLCYLRKCLICGTITNRTQFMKKCIDTHNPTSLFV